MDSSASHSEDDHPSNTPPHKGRSRRSDKLQVKLDGKKKQLYKSIKRKMNRIDSDSDSEEDNSGLGSKNKKPKINKLKRGNKNAKKQSRRVEISWVHDGRAMRARTGGGTRKLMVSNCATPEDIILEAKKYFFPDGRSARGIEAERCSFELRDFSHNRVADHETVADVHERLMPLGILRFHVYTTLKASVPNIGSETSSTADKHVPTDDSGQDTTVTNKQEQPVSLSPKIPSSSLAENKQGNQPALPVDPKENTTHEALDSCAVEGVAYYVLDVTDSDTAHFVLQADLEQDFDVSDTLPLETQGLSDTEEERVVKVPPVEEFATPPLPDTAPSTSGLPQALQSPTWQSQSQTLTQTKSPPRPRSPTPPPEQVHVVVQREETGYEPIYLHRSTISEDMIATFKNPDIVNTPIKFRFVDEAGADAQGVSREAYSAFWKDFFLKYACGESERVPVIFPEYGMEEWKAVGRILLKGLADTGVYPIQLSYAFSVAVIQDESKVTPEILLDSFRVYLGETDRSVIDSALNGKELDDDAKDDFLDLLSRVDCHTIPDADSVRPAILSIAHKELIQQPNYALDSIASTAREGLRLLLPDINAIHVMYDAKRPTARKVTKLLKAEPRDKDQSSSLGFLKQFIRGLDDNMLRKFLRYFTGAEVICTPAITVAFNRMRGFDRAPQAHTCGPLLELPSTYSSYTDLRREFISLLESNYLNMDVV